MELKQRPNLGTLSSSASEKTTSLTINFVALEIPFALMLRIYLKFWCNLLYCQSFCYFIIYAILSTHTQIHTHWKQYASWKILTVYYVRESKQPNGCFSLRWTQCITASERVNVTPPPFLSALSQLPLSSSQLSLLSWALSQLALLSWALSKLSFSSYSALSLSSLSQLSLSALSLSAVSLSSLSALFQLSLSCLLAPSQLSLSSPLAS